MQVESDPEITMAELAIILASFVFIIAALTILTIFLLKRGKKAKEEAKNSAKGTNSKRGAVGGKDGGDIEAAE